MGGLNLNKAEFVKSAADRKQFIQSSQYKIVFAGKSNVGKSSVINKILNRNNFARVGNTPGKTIHVNYFLVDGRVYFIDLPGYGFAKVSADEKKRWSDLMESFFKDSDFTLGVLIVDARHKPTAEDISMCEYFKNSGRKFIVIANKADKLKKSEIEPNMNAIEDAIGIKPILFSAQNGTGRDILIAEINKVC